MQEDIRWKQRFENFSRACLLLQEVTRREPSTLNQLEREGAIQRFEMAFELAWKTLHDFMEASGLQCTPVTPRNVIKEAFAAGILEDAQVWIDMMLDRNRLAHTYDVDTFEAALVTIVAAYAPAIGRLHSYLAARMEGA